MIPVTRHKTAATLVLCLMATAVCAETVVPTRTIRANSIISGSDLKVISETIDGAVSNPTLLAGMEARTNLYIGRPIRPADIGPPAIVERNQIITLVFTRGGLNIATEGRALDRGGVGDRLRAMNLSSRTTVFGVIDESGAIRVGN